METPTSQSARRRGARRSVECRRLPTVLGFAMGLAAVGAAVSAEPDAAAFAVHRWEKHPGNPVLPPGGGDFDTLCCMNPFVLRVADEYFLFYAGGDAKNARRICLATAPVSDVTAWTRHGPVLELGDKGAFDERWCVLPCVHRIGGRWHLYYTGLSGDAGGLQAFRGIGLALSDDLRTWRKHAAAPVLEGDGFADWPGNRGIAGGGRIVELPQSDGSVVYRMHYTLATGSTSPELRIDQAKQSVVAHSRDGITWTERRVVLRPRDDADYENVATIALNVWPTKTRWRAIYAAIGTRFGAYSICEAVSDDGLVWHRGPSGGNLSLPPSGKGWESQMTEYPNVIEENGRLRLFYCGNGYGRTGIGTATAAPLD